MVEGINFHDSMRRRLETSRVLRRWWLRKLVKELENPGKRQHALHEAKTRFGVTTVEEVEALLEAMPQPKTTAERRKRISRRKRGRLKRLSRDLDIESCDGQSVQGQEEPDRE